MNGQSDSVPQFIRYTEEQRLHINYNLEKSLGPEYVSFRAAAGGSQVVYIEGWKALNLANQIFGFNGWSSEIRSTQVDYVDHLGGKWSLGLSAIVRVILKDGTFHEDIGYGNIENCKSRAMAFDKAKKEAVTDGIKRALRQFGNVLGNCLYEKNYLHKVKQVKKIERNTTDDQLLRPEENIRPQFDQYGKLISEQKPSLPVPKPQQQQRRPQQNAPAGKIIPEDSYMEDSFLFSDEVFEEEMIADHEMELLLDKNTKSPQQDIKTPEPTKQKNNTDTGMTFVSTRLARDLIEAAPAKSPIVVNEDIAFNAQVRTPLHDKTMIDQTKSAPIKRTPLTTRKVIYESSKKPLAEDDPTRSVETSQRTPDHRPQLAQIHNNANKNLSFDDPSIAQKRTIGMPPGRDNKRLHRAEASQ